MGAGNISVSREMGSSNIVEISESSKRRATESLSRENILTRLFGGSNTKSSTFSWELLLGFEMRDGTFLEHAIFWGSFLFLDGRKCYIGYGWASKGFNRFSVTKMFFGRRLSSTSTIT